MSFLKFLNFWIFLKITQVSRTYAVNVGLASKLITQSHIKPGTLHISPIGARTIGQDMDLLQAFSITASQLTRIFTCNQRLSSTVLSSQADFSNNEAPTDTDIDGPENVVPTFQDGVSTIPKNDTTRYNTQDITTVSNTIL